MNRIGPSYRAGGGEIKVLSEPRAIAPGLWLTGPVPRVHNEKNWSGAGKLRLPAGDLAEDTVPEDMALVCETSRGLIVLTGCAHAGVVNSAEFARKIGKGAEVYAILGGLHLMSASDQKPQWTAGRLKDAGVQLLPGTHCTGVESCYRLREYMGGRRGEVVVGATGATFSLAGGLNPGVLSR